jgi:hypothetical protein
MLRKFVHQKPHTDPPSAPMEASYQLTLLNAYSGSSAENAPAAGFL